MKALGFYEENKRVHVVPDLGAQYCSRGKKQQAARRVKSVIFRKREDNFEK